MKLTLLLSRIAALAVVATAAGLAFNALALGLFAGASGLFVLLIAAGDYSRRPAYARDYRSSRVAAAPALRLERMPLAA